MVWKVCFDRFNLGHLVWDVSLERFGLSKDFAQKKIGGKFRWKKCSPKNYWFKVILIKKNNLVKKKNLVKKIVVKSRKICQKILVLKSFWSQTILPEKICIQKYLVTSIKILVPCSLRHRVK